MSKILSAKTACEVIPIEDAAVVLGQNAKQHDTGATGCSYEVTTPRWTMTVEPPQDTPNAKATFTELMQAARQSGASVREDPGVGYTIFSVVTKESQAVYIVKGTKTIAFSVINTKRVAPPLPDLTDKMRIVAKRAASRL